MVNRDPDYLKRLHRHYVLFKERLEGTLATTALGIASGVHIVRVHDVDANVRTARMSDAIIRGGWTEPGS